MCIRDSRSVINALVLTGAVPVYVNPQMNDRLGISLGMSVADVKAAIEKHPSAKAILVNNPTYYGICSDLKEIVRLGHAAGMKVLADEAHGTHFYFGENMPVSAMAAGEMCIRDSFHAVHPDTNWQSALEHGEKIGIGTRQYELIKI